MVNTIREEDNAKKKNNIVVKNFSNFCSSNEIKVMDLEPLVTRVNNYPDQFIQFIKERPELENYIDWKKILEKNVYYYEFFSKEFIYARCDEFMSFLNNLINNQFTPGKQKTAATSFLHILMEKKDSMENILKKSPGIESPGIDSPGTESPGIESPYTESPGIDSPGIESPYTESPGIDSPGIESPYTESPGTESPGTESPYTESPDTNSSKETFSVDIQDATLSIITTLLETVDQLKQLDLTTISTHVNKMESIEWNFIKRANTIEDKVTCLEEQFTTLGSILERHEKVLSRNIDTSNEALQKGFEEIHSQYFVEPFNNRMEKFWNDMTKKGIEIFEHNKKIFDSHFKTLDSISKLEVAKNIAIIFNTIVAILFLKIIWGWL